MASRKKRVVNSSYKRFSVNRFVNDNFNLALDQIKEFKRYIIFATALLVFAILIGVIFPWLIQRQVLKLITQLVKDTKDLGWFQIIAFIMFNNMETAFFAMALGIFFGIAPFFIVLINGYILGFVTNKTISSLGILSLGKLIPHGIFELPAILISLALGFRLGMFLFVYRGKNKGREFWQWIKDSLRIFVFIVIPLLVIAGIIEGTAIIILG